MLSHKRYSSNGADNTRHLDTGVCDTSSPPVFSPVRKSSLRNVKKDLYQTWLLPTVITVCHCHFSRRNNFFRLSQSEKLESSAKPEAQSQNDLETLVGKCSFTINLSTRCCFRSQIQIKLLQAHGHWR